MSARPIHHLLITDAPAWVLAAMEKCFRGFFWAGKDTTNGGQCLVAWDRICRPQEFGGLGVKDLRLHSLALWVRWEWLRRSDPERPGQGLPLVKDADARAIFDCLVRIRAGDGQHVMFWTDRWINGKTACEIAPGITGLIATRAKNSRTVAQGLDNNAWLTDVPGTLAFRGAREVLVLWAAVSNVERNQTASDSFYWPWSKSGCYSARSTYNMLVQGRERFPLAEPIWKCWAAPKCKLFVWLASQHRIWTSDRRFRHGLQDRPSACFVCLQEEDTADHILAQCVFARQVWHRCGEVWGDAFIAPSQRCTLQGWWLLQRSKFRDKDRRRFDTLVCIGCHALWKNRNAWCFDNRNNQMTLERIAANILEELNLAARTGRAVAGAGDGAADDARE